MMRSINADARVTVQSFDIEHEEYEHTEMSVEEALDFATDEGCPPAVDAVPVVRCRDCKYYNITCCSPGFGWCERSGHNHGTTDYWFCADGVMEHD